MTPSPATDPGDPASYAARVARHVPGLRDLHVMAGILLAEHVPDQGRVLILGAGGGLELQAFSRAHPGWHFDGVDPSPAMIAQARLLLGSDTANITFHQGYIDDAPEGPFDGAACLLTLHFLRHEERLRTLRAVHRRLSPGAPFIAAHHSFPAGGDGEPDLWLRRNAAWLVAGGMDEAQALAGIETMKERLPVLSPAEDERLLIEAGFHDVQLFYAALTFKGWVARA